jgi:hypothetical protein
MNSPSTSPPHYLRSDRKLRQRASIPMISQTSALYYLPSWMQPTRTHNTSGFLVHSCLYCPTSHLVSHLPHSPHRHEKRLSCRSHHPPGFQRPPHQPPPRTSATATAHNIMSTKDHSPHVFQRRCFPRTKSDVSSTATALRRDWSLPQPESALVVVLHLPLVDLVVWNHLPV